MLFNDETMTEELFLFSLQENYIAGFLPKAGDSSVHSALYEFPLSHPLASQTGRYNNRFTATAAKPGLSPQLVLKWIERFGNGLGIRPFIKRIACFTFHSFFPLPLGGLHCKIVMVQTCLQAACSALAGGAGCCWGLGTKRAVVYS